MSSKHEESGREVFMGVGVRRWPHGRCVTANPRPAKKQ